MVGISVAPMLAASAVALVACTPTEPTAAPQNETTAGASADPVIVASNRGRTTLSPGAITLGRFVIEGGCLRFVTAEASYLAVFGSGGAPAVSGNSLRYSGRDLVFGEEYQIGGGATSLQRGVFELDPEVQRSCAGPYFQIGPLVNR